MRRWISSSPSTPPGAIALDDLDPRTVESYVGNGAALLIQRAMGEGFSGDELARALDFFIHFYRDHSLDHTVFYPGAQGVIRSLASAGIAQAVLTNKPVRISKEILAGLGLGDAFFRVYGGNSFKTKKPDPEGLLRLIEEAATSPEQTLMVGDSTVDIQTARTPAMPQFAGVALLPPARNLSVRPSPDLPGGLF
ncbi:MAG: HAD-IA family hydrolase [Bryobacterales bacterium]|nr:HAD-IA family hydrolase [Bryobacterales bacterium]